MLEKTLDSPGEASSPAKPPNESKKRKRAATMTPSKAKDNANDAQDQELASPSKKKTKPATPKKAKEEKRLKRFRQHAPSTHIEKLHRATTQR